MAIMLAGAVLISTSAPWVKLVDVAPSVSAFYRMLFGGIGLVLFCLVTRRALWAGLGYTLRFVPVAAFFAADLFLWHRSIIYIGPGLATILANFQVFVMALVGWLWFKERLSLRFVVGLLAAFTGTWLLVGVDWKALGPDARLGVWLGLGTAVAYSAFILSMRAAQQSSASLRPAANLGLMSLWCALILAVVVAVEGQSFAIPTRFDLGVLLIYGLFCQVLGWVLITKAMPSLPASVVGFFLLLQPALSMLWDILFFARPTDAGDLVGAALILTGMYIAHYRTKNG